MTTATASTSTCRGSLSNSLWAMYALSLRQHLHGKRWLIMALFFLLPAGLAVLVRSTAPDSTPVELEFALAFMFIPQAVLPLVALVYASGMTQDEQEEQTFTYLLVRPIPKAAIYLAKLAATITATWVLTACCTALTYVAIFAGAGQTGVLHRYAVAIEVDCLSMLAYCSLFGLLGVATKRPLILGILYTAIVEGVFANLPFGIRLITVIYYARIITYRSMAFIDKTPWGRDDDLAANGWQLDVARDPLLAEHPTLRTCVIVLWVGSLVFAVLAAWLCAGKEFHVKTPEKAGT